MQSKWVDMKFFIVFLKYLPGQISFYFPNYTPGYVVLLHFLENLPEDIHSTVFP
jgi:hypothetical protein